MGKQDNPENVTAARSAMNGAMSVLDQVRALITSLTPSPICDDCVTEKLGLSSREYANQKTRELARSDRFERRRDICAICYGEKLVTRRKPG